MHIELTRIIAKQGYIDIIDIEDIGPSEWHCKATKAGQVVALIIDGSGVHHHH